MEQLGGLPQIKPISADKGEIIPENTALISLPLRPLSGGVKLTPRQKQIVEILQENIKLNHGLPSNKELANKLGIDEGTVKVYLQNLKQKTGISSTLELAFIDTGENKSSELLSFRLIPMPNGVNFTPREIELIKHLRGVLLSNRNFSQKELAHEIDIEHNSYKVYVHRILHKTGLESLMDLAFLDVAMPENGKLDSIFKTKLLESSISNQKTPEKEHKAIPETSSPGVKNQELTGEAKVYYEKLIGFGAVRGALAERSYFTMDDCPVSRNRSDILSRLIKMGLVLEDAGSKKASRRFRLP